VVVLGVVGGLLAAVVGAVWTLTTAGAPSASGQPCTVGTSDTGGRFGLTTDQAQNASIIAGVAYRQGLPDHAVTVALAASLQETRLQNLPYGDRDSVGLFQQRPSEGWGSTAQLLDPSYATSAFYDRLVKIPGWQTMAVTAAAQAVQQSATPLAYGAWEGEARSLAVSLTGEVAGGLSCQFSSFGGTAPEPSALGQALATEMGSNLLGVRLGAKAGWQVATWAVAHAFNYHLRAVSFAGLTWQAGSGGWAPDATGANVGEVTVQAA
jgi:hypothetical protein